MLRCLLLGFYLSFADISYGNGQVVADFSVSWNRLRHSGLRIPIPVVIAAVPNQNAAEALDRFDQIAALHATSSSSTLRTSGIWPPVMSR